MSSSGALAVKHAAAILGPHFPVIQTAMKTVLWIPDKARPGQYIPRSKPEDVFRCLDFLCLAPGRRPFGVQVTTFGTANPHASSVARRKKIDEHLVAPLLGDVPLDLEVWAWERGVGMKSWWWQPPAHWIKRTGYLRSPLLERGAKVNYVPLFASSVPHRTAERTPMAAAP